MTDGTGVAVAAGLAAGAALVAWPTWPSRRRQATGSRRAGAGQRCATVYDAADAATLLAMVLRAGLGPVEALEVVAARVGGAVGGDLFVVAAAHRWGEAPEAAWSHVGATWRPVAHAWRAAVEAGVSPAELVEAAARRLREGEDRRVETAVERAGVVLVLPLGLAFLPGFVATTIVPVVLQLVGTLAG